MERYRFTEQLQVAYESMQVPFAVYQFLNKRIVTLALSDGFCELFGYEDKEQAYHVSFGISVREKEQGAINMREMVREAENGMYSTKREFYRLPENNRRDR